MHRQIQSHRQSSKQCRWKQGGCHFHGDSGRRQPFHNEFLIIQNCFFIFLIKGSYPAKCLNNLYALYVFHNSTFPEKSSGTYDKTFRAISLSSVPLQNNLIYSLLKIFLCVRTSSYIFFDVS